MSWFKVKYKVKIIKLTKYCERKTNTEKMKYSKRMDKALTLFWRETPKAKEIPLTGKYYLVLLKKQR